MERIAIHSAPRSGSTWLGNIFNSHPNVCFKYQPLFSYALKDSLSTNASKKEINEFFKVLATTKSSFLDQQLAIANGLVPSFEKFESATHLIYKEVRYHNIVQNILAKTTDVKFIFLIRNPLAVLYSWWKAPKEFREDQGWVFMDEWQYAKSKNLDKPEEFNGYERWKESTILFQELFEQYPERVRLVEYHDLIHNTVETVWSLFEFANLSKAAQTIDFIRSSRSKTSKDAYAVFKAKSSDSNWKQLPKPVIEYIKKDLDKSALSKFLR